MKAELCDSTEVALMKKDKKDEGESFFRWLPVLISIFSLILSAYTLWTTKLSPFHLAVMHSGRVDLTSNPLRANRQLGISLQLAFFNDGATQGYVGDAALVLRKADSPGKPILLRGVYEILEDTLNLGKESPPPKMLAFTSFPVKPGETIMKKLVYVPDDSESELRFERAVYLLIPYTIEIAMMKQWQDWPAIKFEVTEGDLEALAKTTVGPSEEGKQFVNWITQSKLTVQQEENLQRLKDKVGAK
jgi:hypothetical protein